MKFYADNMNFYKIAKDIEREVNVKYPKYGVNKRREIIRLIFEIIKRDKRDINDLLNKNFKSYTGLKNYLLSIRYPFSYNKNKKSDFYLPILKLDSRNLFIPSKFNFYPENIYYESAINESELLKNLKRKFTYSKFIEIDNLKNLKKEFSIIQYNNRRKNLFVVKEKFDFVKPCPCTKNCVSCNYFILNIGFGCPYECSYCFLQGYQNFPGLIIPANIEDFFYEFDKKFNNIKNKIRIGTGEFTDSLALDEFTDFSKKIINFFSNKENVYFEFKTKNASLNNLFKIKPSENIVISFSITPPEISTKNEYYCSTFEERVNIMKELSNYGYSIAIHFDPIIKVKNWEEYYKNFIGLIFYKILPEKIKWISCGTFRFKKETKCIIENRFIDNEILDEEMVLDFDGKLRYPFDIRYNIYSKIIYYLTINGFDKNKIYLCMENREMWSRLEIPFKFSWL